MADEGNIMHFNNLWDEIDASYHEAATRLGLSDSAMLILYMLSCGGGQCLLRDITRTAVSRQTVNSALRKLEAEGIVRTEAADGRKKLLRLTESGRRLAEDTVAKVISAEKEIYSSWTDEELRLYFELTERFLKDFRAKTADF